jgi:hypothetical protein
MTAVGRADVRRMNLVCIGCRDSLGPLDGRLGLTEYLSPQAKRLCRLAGGSWSFDRAHEHLESFCGISVSDELIRRITGTCAQKLAAFAATAPEPVPAFVPAPGDVEFETDAVKVNTITGWRDAKIGIFAKRPRGSGGFRRGLGHTGVAQTHDAIRLCGHRGIGHLRAPLGRDGETFGYRSGDDGPDGSG